MRIGIIGCGAVTRYCHVPALARMHGVTIAAVADPDQRSRSFVAEKSGAVAHSSFETLLDLSDIDSVLVAAPSGTHAAIAIAAARARKAIYIEKPIATAIHDARELKLAVAASGVAAMVGFNRRAHPLYIRARELVRSGAIGEVHAIHSVFSEPTPRDGMPDWKRARATGGGVLLDLASHHFDLIRWLTSAEVSSVSASARSLESDDDCASTELKLTNGAIAQSFFSLRSAYDDHMELIGEMATLRIDRHTGALSMMSPRRFGYGANEKKVRVSAGDMTARIRRMLKPGEDPSYHAALVAFAAQIDGKREALASLDDGEKSLAIVLAAEESARSGSPVRPETIA